jgi:hypothetical protein
MAHKDTLTLYNELIAGGVEEKEAQVKAKQLGEFKDEFGKSLNELGASLKKIDVRLEAIDKDLFWMRVIGGAMTLAFFSNGLTNWFK